MAVKIPRSKFLSYVIGFIIVFALFSVIMAIATSIGQKEETLYSSESKLYDKVYVDIVSINPVSITTKGYVSAPQNEGFFCSCEATDGTIFNAYVSANVFDEYIEKSKYGEHWTKHTPDKIVFDTPLRIHGIISNRKIILRLKSLDDESLVFNIKTSNRINY